MKRVGEISLGLFSLAVVLLTAFVGARAHETFWIPKIFPLILKYDFSFHGLGTFLWAGFLIGGCTLLLQMGFRFAFGTKRTIWTLLIILPIAWLVFPSSYMPTQLFVISFVAISGGLALLLIPHLKGLKSCSVWSSLLFLPYSFFLIAETSEWVIPSRSINFGDILRIIVFLLPLACIVMGCWFASKRFGEQTAQEETAAGVIWGTNNLTHNAITVTAVVSVCLGIAVFGITRGYQKTWEDHVVQYGHEPPRGIHVDLVEEKGSIGIPGVNHLYEAHLFNFSYFPALVEECYFIDDVGWRSSKIAYRVQKRGSASDEWQSVGGDTGEYFCKTYFGVNGAKTITSLLMPGEMRSTSWEATAGREGLKKGDSIRFVVLTRIHSTSDSDFGSYPTQTIILKEESEDKDTQYRLRH